MGIRTKTIHAGQSSINNDNNSNNNNNGKTIKNNYRGYIHPTLGAQCLATSAIAAGKLRKRHQNIREKRQKQAAARDKRPIKNNLKVKPGKNHAKHFFSTQTTQLTRKNPNLKQFFFMISNVPSNSSGEYSTLIYKLKIQSH